MRNDDISKQGNPYNSNIPSNYIYGVLYDNLGIIKNPNIDKSKAESYFDGACQWTPGVCGVGGLFY